MSKRPTGPKKTAYLPPDGKPPQGPAPQPPQRPKRTAPGMGVPKQKTAILPDHVRRELGLGGDAPDSAIKKAIGGSLRVSDPRRYFVEVMVGAMRADGEIDAREMATLRRWLSRQDLFRDLNERQATALVEVGIDSVAFAGGADRRFTTISDRLQPRIHRLAAYAMACEIIAADEVVCRRETDYLDALRDALVVSDREHDALMAAAREGRGMRTLETLTARLRQLAAPVIELCLLRRMDASQIRDSDCQQLIDLLDRLADFSQPSTELDATMRRARDASRNWAPASEAARLARTHSDPADRYWLVVWALTFEAARGGGTWQEIQFYSQLRATFRLAPETMQAAQTHAARLEATNH